VKSRVGLPKLAHAAAEPDPFVGVLHPGDVIGISSPGGEKCGYRLYGQPELVVLPHLVIRGAQPEPGLGLPPSFREIWTTRNGLS
jgi:hypothetical protein